MKCPKCKLENPDDALLCDCGYNFETQIVDQSRAQELDLGQIPSSVMRSLGWIFSLLGGIFGIIIVYDIAYSKQNGMYKNAHVYRQQGKKIIMLAVAMLILFIVFNIIIIFSTVNPMSVD